MLGWFCAIRKLVSKNGVIAVKNEEMRAQFASQPNLCTPPLYCAAADHLGTPCIKVFHIVAQNKRLTRLISIVSKLIELFCLIKILSKNVFVFAHQKKI